MSTFYFYYSVGIKNYGDMSVVGGGFYFLLKLVLLD